VSARDVAEPEPGCGHYAALKLQPWDPEVARLRRIARRRGVKPKAFCAVCRRWVVFTAWPPYPDGLAARYGARIPARG
jgi:hypothetical protein